LVFIFFSAESRLPSSAHFAFILIKRINLQAAFAVFVLPPVCLACKCAPTLFGQDGGGRGWLLMKALADRRPKGDDGNRDGGQGSGCLGTKTLDKDVSSLCILRVF